MRTVGRFALGGAGLVVAVYLAGFAIEGFSRGFAVVLGDVPWLVLIVFFGGLLGAGAGAALGLLALLLHRLLKRPVEPRERDAPGEGSWPPPPNGPA